MIALRWRKVLRGVGAAAEEPDEDEVLARLNAKLDEARRNSAASKPFMSHDRND